MKKSQLFWGILLIGAGAVALLRQMGYIGQFPQQVWIAIFAVISLAGLASYAMSGWKQWGWLFPAGIFGGLAVTTALAIWNANTPAIATPLFIGLLIPFVAAYVTDRARNWWALIPGGVMLFLALTTLVVGTAGGDWVGSLFLFMLAASFLIVYLNNRRRSWAVLVAYIFVVLSIAPAMGSNPATEPYYGALFIFAIAVPFFIVYFRSVQSWWAIIPAGVLTALSIVVLAAIAGWIEEPSQGGYVAAVLIAGLTAAFALIWLQRGKAWAKVVTIVLAAVAVASAIFAAQAAILLPLAIIAAGGYLLFIALRARRGSAEKSS
jgi:hypothetical protein